MSIQVRHIVWEIPASLHAILLIIQVISAIGLIVSLLQIDLLRFLGFRQVKAYLNGDSLPLPTENLQIKGLYRFVRHPLYLFSIVSIWSVSSMADVYLGFCIGATLYFVVGSLYEERRLIKTFGEPYINYQQRVPWLIPFVRLPISMKT
jgi:protein-S-isoprenylcysteine O-methyltransferase Ste14